MKKLLGATTALVLFAPIAQAGGLDRSGQGLNIIFEPGTVVQGTLTFVDPSISGTLAGTDSGDIGESYILPHLSFKTSIGENWDISLGYDEPYGADVAYAPTYALSTCNQSVNIGGGPGSPTFNPGCSGQAGSQLKATAETRDLVGVARYKFANGFSAIGGIRVQTLNANVSVPAALNYTYDADGSTEVGYIVGASWERPDIAARIALTYNSRIEHTMTQTETTVTTLGGTTVTESESKVSTPASFNLDFQTGVAADTLLFGSIRYAKWTDTEVIPGNYPAGTPTGTLLKYNDDIWTYTLGLGRNITENFSLAFLVSHETQQGGTVTDLGPTDGYTGIGVGGTYSFESSKLSAGIRYNWLGNVTTNTGALFEDNTAYAVGVQYTYYIN